jgi:endonuclease/exonuclease/phosphatase family metal-dependent hydrolase
MRHLISLGLGVWLLAAAPGAVAADIEVMTQNQFLGADLNPLIAAFGTPQQDEVLAATLAQMAANNFPLRARALARQICDKQPHVVGLQEVFRFSIDGVSGEPLPLPFVDHLEELMAAIARQCDNYGVAASVQNVDVGAPVAGVGVIGFTDRDVILTREDVSFQPVPFALACANPAPTGVAGLPPSGCSYSNLLPLPAPLGFVQRGFVGVDALVDGVVHRVVNTHLEVMKPDGSLPSTFFQAAQASELLVTLDLFPKPPGARTIVVGDFNSSPDDAVDATLIFVPPYGQFANGVDLVGNPISAPYADIWPLRPGKPPGLTCCHKTDLSIRRAPLRERIDLIFSLEVPDRVRAAVLGDEASEWIRRLWPSDHASVHGELTY